MEKLNKIIDVKVPEQEIEIDPRSKSTYNGAFNHIATGGPEMPVRGMGKVLPEKKRNSKAY